MKIIYFANSRLPTEKAHGIQIMETCQALAKEGVDLKLILPRRFNIIKKDIFNFYGLPKNFTIRKIACLDLMFLPIGKKLTFLIESISFALSSWWYIVKLKKQYDALYTRDFIIATLGLFGKSFFYEIHTLPRKIKWWHKLVWRKCQGFIVISETLRNELVQEGIESNKIIVARDGVDIEKFDIKINKKEARNKLKLAKNKQIVVYTGHLYLWKGADLLAEASSKISPDVDVYLVGGTAKDVVNFKTKYKFSNLHIVEHQSVEKIPLWLKAADLLILPNSAKEKISSHYTSPLKLFEYMASGSPIIASDLPSIKEILTEDEAIFFTPDNKNDLVKKINISLNKLDQLNVKAKLAFEKVKQYSWQKRAELIKKMLNNKI